MRRAWQTVAVGICVAALFAPSLPAQADGPGEEARARVSEGPRSVPRPRGASLARARMLGLGTRAVATRLLTAAPEARWTAAVHGRRARTLLWPVEGARLGRGFGFTRRERQDLRHEGLDIAGETGAAVRAVADGLVAYADNGVRGFGHCVMLVHADGAVSLYAHLSRITVQPGWRATRGERLGLVGATGIARGPHLHFELREGGRTRDPEPRFAAIPGRPAAVVRVAAPRSPAPPPGPDAPRAHAARRARCGHDRNGALCASGR